MSTTHAYLEELHTGGKNGVEQFISTIMEDAGALHGKGGGLPGTASDIYSSYRGYIGRFSTVCESKKIVWCEDMTLLLTAAVKGHPPEALLHSTHIKPASSPKWLRRALYLKFRKVFVLIFRFEFVPMVMLTLPFSSTLSMKIRLNTISIFGDMNISLNSSH